MGPVGDTAFLPRQKKKKSHIVRSRGEYSFFARATGQKKKKKKKKITIIWALGSHAFDFAYDIKYEYMCEVHAEATLSKLLFVPFWKGGYSTGKEFVPLLQ